MILSSNESAYSVPEVAESSCGDEVHLHTTLPQPSSFITAAEDLGISILCWHRDCGHFTRLLIVKTKQKQNQHRLRHTVR